MAKNRGTTSNSGVPAPDSSTVRVLEERVGWIQKIGWGIAGIYLPGFGIFIGSYLP
jgi:hypothetical protein